MEDLRSLQQQIRDLGLRIRVEGNKLLIRGHPGRLSVGGLGMLERQKKDLIAFLQEKSATSTPNIAPLTYRQEWNWQRMREEGNLVSSAHMSLVTRMLEGVVDVERLARSFDILVARHESLRTRFVEIDSLPMQQIDDFRPGQLVIEAVVAAEGVEPEVAARRNLTEFSSMPVDVCRGPLFQAKLLGLGDCKHILAMRLHHMITDAESMTQLFAEIWDSYKGGGVDEQPQSPLGRYQFADYAAWQRSAAFDWHESFWREQLRGAQSVIWPIDKERDSEHRFSGRIVRVDFRKSFSDDLQRLAQRLRTIPGLMLLAAYAVLIRYWCNQADFVIPFAINGRTAPEHAEMMGWLAYPLLIRLRVDHELTFAAFTEYVVQEFTLALENADGGRLLLLQLPYISEGTFVRWATAVKYENASTASSWISIRRDLDVKRFPFQTDYPEVFELRMSPVVLLVDMFQQRVRGCIAYRSDLFSRGRMLALARSMCMTFEALVSDPDMRISEYEGLVTGR